MTNSDELSRHHNTSNLFLASGIVCSCIAGILFFFRKEIAAYPPLGQFTSSLEILADDLWSFPSILTCILILLFISWLYYYLTREERPGGYIHFLLHASFTRLLLPIFFLYTIFPLRWAQRTITRAPESFPTQTPFDTIVLLFSWAGMLCYCFYCCKTLPQEITSFTENLKNRFFQMRENRFVGFLVVTCFLLTGLIAYTVLDHIPHVQDSIAQLFQAKIFQMGKLYVASPSHKDFFDYSHVINDGRWYSQYPPGHAVLLLCGLFFRIPWLIGPVLGTCSLMIFYLLIKNVYTDHCTTYLGTTFLLLSPFFLFMSSSHMNHTSTMFFILVFLYFYQRSFSSHSATHALMAGLSLGCAVMVRPLTAGAIGLPFMCHLFYCVYRSKEVPIKNVLIFLAGLAIMASLLLLYNELTNGNPLLFGYQKKYQTLGFLGNAQGGEPHTLKGGVINTSNNLIGLNNYLFAWPVPSLIFIFAFLALPIKKNRWDWLFCASALSLITSYFFYYHQDYIYGPRFYYSLTPFLIIFTVRGFLAVPTWLEKKGCMKRTADASLFLFILLCFLYTLSCSYPALIKKYSHDYWWVTDKLHRKVEEQGITNAVVFIDCWHPLDPAAPHLIYYGSGFQFNSPDLTDDVIYALDLKERNRELMEAYPGRNYYFCNFFWDPNRIAW